MAQVSFTARVFAVAATFCLAWLTWSVLREVFAPALWAAFAAIMLWPFNLRARQRLGGRNGTAAAILTVGSVIGVAVPLGLMGAEFVQEASKLAQRLASLVGNPPDFSAGVGPAGFGARIFRRVQQSLPAELALEFEHVRARAIAALGSGLNFLVSHLGNVFFGALGAASSFVLSLVVLFYALRDGERMIGTAVAMIPLDPPRRQVLVDHLGIVTRALVVGALAAGAVQGALVGAALAVVGLPAPVFFGVLAAIVSVLPFGTSIVWLPAAIVLALKSRFVAAGFMMLWGILVVSSMDNIIRPRIVSKKAKVSAFAVFLGVVGGIASFGLIGVFLGPLILITAMDTARLLLGGSPTPVGAGAAIEEVAGADGEQK